MSSDYISSLSAPYAGIRPADAFAMDWRAGVRGEREKNREEENERLSRYIRVIVLTELISHLITTSSNSSYLLFCELKHINRI